jgi:hypothetical protein
VVLNFSFGFQIKCSILFGEPQAGKARLLLTKPAVLAPARAGAIPIPDKIEAIFIWNWNQPALPVEAGEARSIVAGFFRALAVARRSRLIVAVFIRKPASQVTAEARIATALPSPRSGLTAEARRDLLPAKRYMVPPALHSTS